MSLDIALADAATNSTRDGATVVITLRSGVRIEGRLEKALNHSTAPTVHVKLYPDGWATVLKAEIVAVEARR